MAYAVLGWQNGINTAQLTQITTSPLGLGIVQLQNDQGSSSMAWQSPIVGLTAGDAQMTLRFTVPVAMQMLSMHRTNLSANASVKITRRSPSTLGDVSHDVITQKVTPVKGQVVIPLDGALISSFDLAIFDPTNPDGFVNIPLMYTGAVWNPISNISYASSSGRDIGVDEVVTRGGQEFPSYRWQRRRWKVDFQRIRQSEVYSQLDSLDSYSRAGGNVLFVPDPASATINYEAVYGRLQSTSDLTWPYQAADARAWQTTITERL